MYTQGYRKLQRYSGKVNILNIPYVVTELEKWGDTQLCTNKDREEEDEGW